MALVEIERISQFVGREVLLKGWIFNIRSSGKILFILVRDGTGVIQCIVEPSTVGEELFEEASTLTQESSLEVTGIRVERVQEIGSDEYKLDVFQEGICECCDHSPESHESDPMERPWTCGGHGGAGCHIDAIDEFRRLWDSINGKRGCGWDVNPWVWVVEFKKIKP